MKPPHLMDLYSDYLLSSPTAVSALVLAKVLNDAYSHNSLTRVLSQARAKSANQEAEALDQTYQKRWSSEDLHRSLKQNTALEKMPAKIIIGALYLLSFINQ